MATPTLPGTATNPTTFWRGGLEIFGGQNSGLPHHLTPSQLVLPEGQSPLEAIFKIISKKPLGQCCLCGGGSCKEEHHAALGN